MDKLTTIIPVRGGSKSIPQKNLQTVNGKSLIERAVIGALKIENNQIFVSTDDPKIAKQVCDYPITVLNRSSVNSTDQSSSESVVLEVLKGNGVFDGIVILLQATSPFIDINGLRTAINTMQKSELVDSMFSAVSKNEFIWELGTNWEPVNHNKLLRIPRQSRSPMAVETGSFYIFKADKFLEEKTRFCGITVPAFTRNWTNFDIDSHEDLELCRDLSQVLDFPPYLV